LGYGCGIVFADFLEGGPGGLDEFLCRVSACEYVIGFLAFMTLLLDVLLQSFDTGVTG